MTSRYYRKVPLERLSRHLKTSAPPLQVILGPRQVGKTTAIQTFIKGWDGPTFYHTADLVSPPDGRWLEEQWQAARKQVSNIKRGLLVVDEVQKIPRWSEVVKKCHDEDRLKNVPLCIILLGSSSLMVQRGLTESLAGRFEIVPFSHWSFAECQKAFGIGVEEYLFYGGYPGALQILIESDFDEERWGEYVRNALIETVLSKDILLLTPVTKPALFRQTFQLSCSYPSEVLSLNKMLGQLQEAGNASTIASYLRLLDAAMLLKPLERYSGSRLRQKMSSPKLVLLNNALVNASLIRNFKQTMKNKETWGRLVENGVGASLVNNNMGKGTNLFYWRDRDDEVDFVLQWGEKLLAIEVKSGSVRTKRGLNEFLRRHPEVKGITVAPQGGDLPLPEFLNMTVEELTSGI